MSRKQRIKIKTTAGDKVFGSINVLVFGVFAFLCVFPFYYVIVNSISDNLLVQRGVVRFWPQGIHFTNYLDVFKMNGIGTAVMNSVLRTILGTLAMLLSSSVLGYAMSKQEYWHRKFWYRFLIITMYFNAGVIPTYLNMQRLGLMNNFWVYVLPSFASAYNMILIKTYMENIPSSLEEAALIDGAGYYKRFTRIVIPLSKPILATVAVFTAVSQWNSFMDTFLYTSGSKYQTLQSLLYQLLNRANLIASMIKNSPGMDVSNLAKMANPASVRFTVTAVTLLPILLVYPYFQRYFTKGIMIGAVKG